MWCFLLLILACGAVPHRRQSRSFFFPPHTTKEQQKEKDKERVREPPPPERVVLRPAEVTVPENYNAYVLPPSNGTLTLDITIRVMRLYLPDWTEQTVEADVDIISEWDDPRIQFDDAEAGKWYQLDPATVWDPKLQFFNMRRSLLQTTYAVTVATNGKGRMQRIDWAFAELSQTFDYEYFPFDRQAVEVKVVSLSYYDTEVRLRGPDIVLDHLGLNDDMERRLSVMPTRIERFREYDNNTREVVVGRLKYSRQAQSWFLDTILPCACITTFACLALLVSPSDISTRITISTIGLLTIMAYMIVVNQQIPPVDYLTWLMEFATLSFMVCFAITIEILAFAYLDPSAKAAGYDPEQSDEELLASFDCAREGRAPVGRSPMSVTYLRKLHLGHAVATKDNIHHIRALLYKIGALDRWLGVACPLVYLIGSGLWMWWASHHAEHAVL